MKVTIERLVLTFRRVLIADGGMVRDNPVTAKRPDGTSVEQRRKRFNLPTLMLPRRVQPLNTRRVGNDQKILTPQFRSRGPKSGTVREGVAAPPLTDGFFPLRP
jgi:hypothetical protein